LDTGAKLGDKKAAVAEEQCCCTQATLLRSALLSQNWPPMEK